MSVVVDTSALAAIVFGEPDAEQLLDVLLAASGDVVVSAATLVECAIVVEARHGSEGTRDLRLLLERLEVETIALDAQQAEAAVAAWRRFGKGHHPAALNLGDCFAYALTATSGGALLYKGDDFSQTDVRSAR